MMMMRVSEATVRSRHHITLPRRLHAIIQVMPGRLQLIPERLWLSSLRANITPSNDMQ